MKLTQRILMTRSLTLAQFTVEGRTNRLLSATALSGPSIQEGEPFVGNGGLPQSIIDRDSTAKFFRVISE